MTAKEILAAQLTGSSSRLMEVLAGIEDEEYFWEPVEGCWTVHRRNEGRAASADGCGEWVIDYEVPEPQPAPLTTIAWRTVHVAAVNVLYWDYAFGPTTASFDLELPGDAVGGVAWLRASQQHLEDALAGLDDDALEEPRLTNWGERLPTWRLFDILVIEQVHHGAEISLLRDLFRQRTTLRA
jgi:uncharacterized damage-inducible protein DinB